MLCVLAEFCFLFPDLLVTKEALPLYKANLGVFRAIMWTSIGTTFLLGALSALLLRSKLHGLLGMALAAVQLLSFASLVPVQAFFAWAVRYDFQAAVAAQPVWLQFLQILLAADLATYWVHRAFHQLPPRWHFHAIHHSSREMDWLAGSRIHLVDALVTRAAAFVPIFVLGFSQSALVAYVAFVSFHAVYIHSNTRWRFPVLRWVIATPEYHHWHHTSDEEGLDKNFAAFLPLWDRLFGTAHLPDHWPKNYGTVEFQPPESYLGQLAYPFRRKRDTPYG